MAEPAKERGNDALARGDLDAAIENYSQAIAINPAEAVYLSNRSAAYTKKGLLSEAIADAERCIEIKPEWAKGYSRKAAALQLKGSVEEAISVYTAGAKAVKDAEGRKSLQKAMMEALVTEKNSPAPKRQQPNKARLTVCIMAAMILGPATQYFVAWGPSILWSVVWCLVMAASGVMIVPEKEVTAPEEKKGLWFRLRPYIFPALYWSQHKKQ